jgi:hypothetical protein
MAEKKKKALQVKKPTTGDYLATLGDMFVVNPRNSPAATLGGAAYDYVTRSTPQSVRNDIVRAGQDAKNWLRKENKALRDAPITESLRLLKAGFIDPLADPYRVFKQAATERSRGNEAGGAKLAAMVPLSVAGVLPQLRVTGRVAANAGVDAATKTATKVAKKAAPSVKVTPKPKAPVNPVTLIDREYGTDTARRVSEYVSSDAPIAEWRAMAERFTDAGKPNSAQQRPSAYTVKPAQVATDPRIETRKKEQQKITDLELEIQPRALEEPPVESIYDLEGRGLLTTMSDLSAAGDDVLAVNNVRLQRPFSRQGGQGFMFENPGEVWAADKINANTIQEAAAELEKQTGKPAILAPFTMGPMSSMFSHHPRGLQYSYADAALDAPEKAMLADSIRDILPEWTDFSDPDAYMTFMRASGKRRGQLNKLMDQARERGGLGKGEAVYGTTDLDQLGAPMLALRNLGEVDTRFGLSESKNPAYSTGVPGQGLAKLKEENLGALSLFPALMEQYGYQTPFDFPVGVNKGVSSPLRSFQLKPQPTIITDKVLRYLDDLRVQGRDKKP